MVKLKKTSCSELCFLKQDDLNDSSGINRRENFADTLVVKQCHLCR